MTTQEAVSRIMPPDEEARRRAKRRWDSLAKPLGSLGRLETALEDIAALTGEAAIQLRPRCVLVLCADNGVTAQGVTQTDSTVTAVMARELGRGRTAVCRMAAAADCRVMPADFGIRDFPGDAGVRNLRVGNGTADFTQGPAMTRAAAELAVVRGISLAAEAKERGERLLAVGEMGIGNTTTASAVTAVLLGRTPAEVTGRGAGLSDAGLHRKIAAIQAGLARNQPDPSDPLDVLTKVGGYDLAGMCGVYLGGALHRIPVVMDGFPSAAAALCAVRLCPLAGGAILASHVSAEPAGEMVLEALDKHPLLTALLRLGEGTGAVAALPLLDMALAVYAEACTFADAGIPAYVPQDRGADS